MDQGHPSHRGAANTDTLGREGYGERRFRVHWGGFRGYRIAGYLPAPNGVPVPSE